MQTQPIVILAAGGTGGHIFPALALAEQLVAHGVTPVFFTDARFKGYTPPEMQGLLASMEVVEVATGRNGGSLAVRLKNLLGIVQGARQAAARMRQLQPAAVVGFGGYPSLPTMLAALLLKLPTLLHDQNAFMGRTNRLLARFVGRIALSYQHTHAVPPSARAKTVVVGNPVRSAINAIGSYPARTADQPLYLLVIGGSQGASIFSTLVPDAIALLPEAVRARLHITQQCRTGDVAQVQARYDALGVQAELAPFFADVAMRLAGAHLVISRAGASSVAEMCVAGRAALFVPLPSAMDNHQWYNALAAAEAGAALLAEQSTLSPQALAEVITRASTEPEFTETMALKAKQMARPHAAEALAQLVMQTTEQKV